MSLQRIHDEMEFSILIHQFFFPKFLSEGSGKNYNSLVIKHFHVSNRALFQKESSGFVCLSFKVISKKAIFKGFFSG